METMILRARPVLPARQWLPPSCSQVKTAAASIAHPKPAATVAASTKRRLSALNRPPPKYPGHVPLTMLERAGLAVGSGIPAFLYPQRADMVAAFGEATATPFFLCRLRDAMLAHPTGRRILRQRPRINSKTISLPDLRALPESTLGHTYVAWVDREGVTPDSRDPVRYVDDEECAYVMQRYRECHDFYHALLGLPTFREAELALKAFEFASTLLPVAGLSLFAAATLKPDQRRRFLSVYLPWAVRNGARCQTLLNVYWEEELGRDVDDLRRELGIERPPDMREMRRQARLRKRREVEEAQGA